MSKKIIVKQLQRPDAKTFIKDVDGTGNQPKDAKAKINSDLPSLITAYFEDDPSESVTWGLRSRRTSHSAEATWWSGTNKFLAREALKGLVYTAILEGRKRVEVFDEVHRGQHSETGDWIRPGTYAQLSQLFTHEGAHPNYTSNLVDVEIFGHVWYFDGVPEPAPESEFTLYVNDRVKFYREKNMELYARDIDLYREDEEGVTFAKRIETAISTVIGFDQVFVLDEPGWHGNELKSVTVYDSQN